MMMSNNQEEQAGKKKPYSFLALAILLCFLMGGLFFWSLRSNPSLSTDIPAGVPDQTKVPTIEYPTNRHSAPEYSISLHSLGDSGITGTVTFKDIGGNVAILLYVNGLPEGEASEDILLPVEIHYGTCAALGALAYPMAAPDAGQSETDLLINLKEFNSQRPMAVVLYRSPQDHTIIACGDIP